MDNSVPIILKTCVYIGIGGALGANARYWVGGWLTQRLEGTFPYATFIVNITGAFLLGLLVTLITERYVVAHPHVRLLVAVGFLGSYTTFSTFEYETLALARSADYFLALLNVGLSLCIGFVAVWLGVWLARFL